MTSLSQDVDQILKTQGETVATLQCVQSAKDENFFLLGNEVRATQQNVNNLRDAVNDHLQVLHYRINGNQGDLIQQKNANEDNRNIPCSKRLDMPSLIWELFTLT